MDRREDAGIVGRDGYMFSVLCFSGKTLTGDSDSDSDSQDESFPDS
jgi:hypothetical protein